MDFSCSNLDLMLACKSNEKIDETGISIWDEMTNNRFVETVNVVSKNKVHVNSP